MAFNNSLKTAVELARTLECWARRVETAAERVVQDHDTDIQSAAEVVTAGLFPQQVAVRKLLAPLATLAQKGLSRFAGSIEDSVSHTVSWQHGTTTFLDMPRF